MEKRITKTDNFNEIIKIATELGRQDLVEFATHEIELIAKRNANKGESKLSKENAEIMEAIVYTLTDLAEPVRISELQVENEKLANLSNQKMSALLKKLVDNGTIKKSIEKKIAYFSI